MFSLRSFLTAFVAAPLLLAGPALAVPTTPLTVESGHEVPVARQVAVARRTSTTHPSLVVVASKPKPVAAPAAATTTEPTTVARLVCLSGTVLGADGLPRPGACVFTTTNTHLIAVADAHGAFQLQVPAEAGLHLQADYFGLGSTRIDVDGQHPQPVHLMLGH